MEILHENSAAATVKLQLSIYLITYNDELISYKLQYYW